METSRSAAAQALCLMVPSPVACWAAPTPSPPVRTVQAMAAAAISWGSLIDVSVAIYAPINIAIAGPHATAEADIDQSAVQIAGCGRRRAALANLAVGGGVAAHLPSDLHLMG